MFSMEEEKRYPVFEEEDGVGKCCEPPVGYAATGSGSLYPTASPAEVQTITSEAPLQWAAGATHWC